MKTLHRTCAIDKVATSAYMFGRKCEVEKNLPFCKFMEVVRNMNLVMTVEKKIGTVRRVKHFWHIYITLTPRNTANLGNHCSLWNPSKPGN
jgi:hypothetical protein